MTTAQRRRDDKTIREMRSIARTHGWAVAVHGSRGQKDLDLVAIPWTPEAQSIETLCRAWTTGVARLYVHVSYDNFPTAPNKPHGRLAILFSRFPFPGRMIDVSFMPRNGK